MSLVWSHTGFAAPENGSKTRFEARRAAAAAEDDNLPLLFKQVRDARVTGGLLSV